MKYSIFINQQVLSGTGLDVIDGAILDYIYFFCNSPNEKIKEKRIIEGKEIWSWVDHKTLLKDMPMLRIKSTGALTPRINKIEKSGFIRTKHFQNRKKYYQMTAKSDVLFIYMNKTVHTDEQYCSYKRTNKDKKIKKKNYSVGKADERSNLIVNEILTSMNSSSGQQDKKPEIFNFNSVLEKMINDKQKHIQVVGIYWKWLGWSFENKEQYESALGRDLRAASALKGYSLARIKRTFKKLDGDSANGEKFAWNLNTVHKTIDNVK